MSVMGIRIGGGVRKLARMSVNPKVELDAWGEDPNGDTIKVKCTFSRGQSKGLNTLESYVVIKVPDGIPIAVRVNELQDVLQLIDNAGDVVV